jgi:basic membrane lipoprotein Med (substrate-binding protein (PBP1-ABC) superfamily)/ABC-type amino acid transport substrate-binding protein
MKKLSFLLVLLLITGLLLGACGGAAEPPAEEPPPAEEGLGGREVTIAVENAYLPFNYIDPDTGEPAGWDYDVWDEICEMLNCTPVYVEAAWEGMIQAVADGQFDAAGDGITITEERAEIVDFSVGYVAIEQRLLVRIDEDRIESIEDIVADETLKLGTQTGTTNYETASTYLPEERIQAFEQFPFAVQAVVAGDIDAVIIDEVAGQGYLGENADALKLVGPSMSSDNLGFIFPKGSELVDLVNDAIEELAQNGFLDEVNAKYFGPDFTISYDDLFPPEPVDFLACQVTDTGGIDDKSFNASAWKGVTDAIDAYGIEGKFLESQNQTDYEPNLNAFVEEGCDVIFPIGYLLGDATKKVADANPDLPFAIVDFFVDSPNVASSGFNMNEGTYLTGYLAAGMTETGVVGTYGGVNIPPVTIFMDGFALGVAKYNEVHGTDVKVVGWDFETQDGSFTGNFESTEDARTLSESMFDEGVDIFMPVGGQIGAGTLALLEDQGSGYLIGVDRDWTIDYASQADYILASAYKGIDKWVTEKVEEVMNDEFTPGLFTGTILNEHVDIIYGHKVEDKIPADLKAEIEQLKADIASGEVVIPLAGAE